MDILGILFFQLFLLFCLFAPFLAVLYFEHRSDKRIVFYKVLCWENLQDEEVRRQHAEDFSRELEEVIIEGDRIAAERVKERDDNIFNN